MSEAATRRPARAGRTARRALRTAPDVAMLPALKRNLPLCEPMDEEQIRKIDNASMAILEEVGVVFRDDIALADWKEAGAKIDGDRVYLDRALVRELVATIPSTIADERAFNPFVRAGSVARFVRIECCERS